MLKNTTKNKTKKLHFLKFHSHRKLLSFQVQNEEPTQGEVKNKFYCKKKQNEDTKKEINQKRYVSVL